MGVFVKVTTAQRDLFDDLLDGIVAELPAHLHDLLEEVPLIVEDEPSPVLLHELGMDRRGGAGLCGLHSGVAMTHRSVEMPPYVPDRMMLFRGPIMRVAGYHARGGEGRATRELERQIRITLLHEIGHHFGLDEDDLTALGYG